MAFLRYSFPYVAALTPDDLRATTPAGPDEEQGFVQGLVGAPLDGRYGRVRSNNKIVRCLTSLLTNVALVVVPSPLLTPPSRGRHSSNSSGGRHADTAYLDGLRGLGALAVYVQHFIMPFHADIMTGRMPRTSSWPSTVFQWPVVRLVYHGSFAVSLFFVLSGVALSHQPVVLLRDSERRGGRDSAAAAAALCLGSASFRRGIRLFVPAVAVVTVTVVLVHLGASDTATRMATDSEILPTQYDLRMAQRLPTLAAQAVDGALFVAAQLVYPATWLRPVPMIVTRGEGGTSGIGSGVYGFHLWTIAVEFWAAQLLFLAWMATLPMRRAHRRGVFVLLALYCVWCLRWEVALFLSGALLADKTPTELPTLAVLPRDSSMVVRGTASPPRHRIVAEQLLFSLVCLGALWAGSMPDFHGGSSPGFRRMWLIMPVEPIWHGIGAVLVVWSVSRCRWLQAPLCHGIPQYLGRVSFALYLIHVPLVTSLGWPLVPWLWQRIAGSGLNLSVAIRETCIVGGGFLVLAVALWVADVFWRLVDLPSIQLAKDLQEGFRVDNGNGQRTSA